MNRTVSVRCGHVKRQLHQGKRLTGELLEFAVGCLGEGCGHDFYEEICRKLRAGEPLGDYESHMFLDVILLHVRLAADANAG